MTIEGVRVIQQLDVEVEVSPESGGVANERSVRIKRCTGA